jgi:hypothetical protein
LGFNQITDAGATALAEALPGSQVMELFLLDNQITPSTWARRRSPRRCRGLRSRRSSRSTLYLRDN